MALFCFYRERTDYDEIARKYHVSVPHLSIRYDYQLGLIPLPRSTNPEHIKENKNIDFIISDYDMNDSHWLRKFKV